MVRNYLLIAWRNISRHKLFSFINVFGLSLSMALCMIAILQISDDLSWDRFHPHPDRTYRIITEIHTQQGDDWKLASSPLPLRASVAGDVQAAVQLYPALQGKTLGNSKSLNVDGCFTDPAFFTVFGFALAKGNTVTALQQPYSVVLTHEKAQQFFGSADPLGQTLVIEGLGTYQVTGVLQPQTAHSHIKFEAYASAATVPQLEKGHRLPGKLEDWNSFNDAYTYVLLAPHMHRDALTAQLDRLSRSLVKDPSKGNLHFKLQGLNRITPAWEETYNNIGGGTTIGKMLALAGVAFIILLSACFNYTNLSIARSLTRAKEVGIRKVSGATRLQIFAQYIMEAVLISLLSLVLAYILMMIAQRTRVLEIVPDVVMDWRIYLSFLIFSLFTGLLAGSLPAWILSSFNPAEVLKSLPSTRLFGRMNLRRGLLVFQLCISLVITVFLFAFYRQFTHMAHADPGFNADRILSVQLQGNTPTLLAQQVSALSGVESVAATSGNFGRFNGGGLSVTVSKDKQAINLSTYQVDRNFAAQMGLQLVAGGNFLSGNQQQMLINERAAATLGFEHPFDAVGQRVWINDSTQAQITGVLKDFHFENMGKNIAPLALRADTTNFQLLNVKMRTADQARMLQQVTAAWHSLYPGQPLQTFWLKEKYYDENAQTSSITTLGFLAAMTILIALLGLLAMVIYSTALRSKEIGVRKVMGANVGNLVVLLSKGYMKLLLIAGLIALPIGWFCSIIFLQNFVVRTPFGIGSVLLCFFILVLLTLVTIVSQTWKAALANPAESLKSE